MTENPVVYWIRNDLRLADNPALMAAAAPNRPVIPLFIWSPDEEDEWPPGAAAEAWLHRSLEALARAYGAQGSRLLYAQGDVEQVLNGLCRETGATAVYAAHRYEPAAQRQEAQVRDSLSHIGVDLHLFAGSVLHPPAAIETNAGAPYQVFTPYYRRCQLEPPPPTPLPVPDPIPAPSTWPESQTLSDLDLIPDHPWAAKVLAYWSPGEDGAHDALAAFLDGPIQEYGSGRDEPAEPGTSSISPHFHFGELSPRQVWHAVQARASSNTMDTAACESYIRQLYWREFAHHLLYHFPHTPDEPLKPLFRHFPWRNDGTALRRWQRGQTGFPFVDAGMRELWKTGWMHNRARMVVASFLVKDLRIHWREGAAWFWDTLVDADLANNTLGWQWVAGCGADAAPYFRIFNPVTQGKRFDAAGDYVRRWVPELAGLPDKYLHCPWTMRPAERAACGVHLGEHYPHPMVDHAAARKMALTTYEEVKSLEG